MTPLFGCKHSTPKNDLGVECVGKSRGGLSTRIHAAVVGLLLSAGQASGYDHVCLLIEGFDAKYVLADKKVSQ